MYKLICHLGTSVYPYQVPQAVIEILGSHQITSLDGPDNHRAFDVAVMMGYRLSPILIDLVLLCSRPPAIMREIARFELRERR